MPQRSVFTVLVVLAVVSVAGFWFVPPIPQPQWYHRFADQRALLGIPNFWNVISNLPFLFVGAWGVWHVAAETSSEALCNPTERWMYLVFFISVALTGVGSAYYHWQPDDDRLVWDRVPLAMMFMVLLAIVITERASRRAGVLLFWPLVIFGAASVIYWHLTESWGRGDLRLYLLAQLYPVVAIPLVLWLCPAVYTRSENLYAAIAWYVGAKIYEMLDTPVYLIGKIVSGHTIKHIGAAVSCYLVLSWLRQRRLIREQSTEIPWPVTGPGSPGR